MNVNFFTLALGAGDVAALATLSAYAREDLPKALDVSFAVVRLLTLCITVRCFNEQSKLRLVAALVVLFAAVPAYLGYNDFQDDAHLKLDFIVSTCFAVCEALLLVLSYQMTAKETAADRPLDDMREALLEEGRAHRSAEISDPYKGQGPSFQRLLSLSYPERYILAVATLALFVSTASSVVTPALFGRLIQTISVANEQTIEDREKELNRVTLLLILMFIVTSIFSLIRGALYTLAGERLVARFRVRLFDAIIHQDIEFFDRNQSGELQSRLSSDTASIQNAVTVNVSMALRWTIQAVVSMVIIFVISWKLTLVMLAVVPAVALGARLYGTFVRDLSKRYQDALAKAAETSEEALGNIRTVRSFCKENFEVKRYKMKVDDSYEQGKRRAWAYGIFVGAIGMLAYLAVALVLWRGGMMVIHGTDDLSSADLTSFLLYTLNLAVCLGGLSELYSTLVSAMGASERLFKILDTDPLINNRGLESSNLTIHKKRTAHGASVVFSGVDFAYPTRQDVKVLKNVSLNCEAGTVNAFCGASGQGKSTIISLIQRFYDPIAGRILIGGVDIQTISPVDLRSRMSIVSQEPTLFASTIAQNIAYGINRAATQEEIVEAAKKANAFDFVSGFPAGFETLVGERGVQLSGGQRQRIAIARAILADPEILLLDEATSALDSQSEHLVQLALNDLMKGRTTIIVAHRLSTVRHADCIFVIDQGTVAEQGTYEQLIASGGLFAALVSRQLSGAGN